jgi:hypothetical protein
VTCLKDHFISSLLAPKNIGFREWAKDVDVDGIREVHCNSCEGAGLRTYLRVFRGVHKKYLKGVIEIV